MHTRPRCVEHARNEALIRLPFAGTPAHGHWEEWERGGAGGRSLLPLILLAAHSLPPTPKRPGAGAALTRSNALGETRAGLHLPVQDTAFRQKRMPYLVAAGAGAAGATGAA